MKEVDIYKLLDGNLKKKSLAEIMCEPANIEKILSEAKKINAMIEETKKAGVVWPELSVCHNCDGTGCYNCNYTGEIDDEDPGYDELRAEADRDEN